MSARAVRQLFAAALARRAEAHSGAARVLLDARLAALAEAPALANGPQPGLPQARPRGPLGRLADEFAPQGRPRELQALQRYRGTWSRLSAEQRLHQALAHVPPQAGPLNSHHLVHRALLLMRETSPEYLQHFVAQVDALLWLDQMLAPALPAKASARTLKRGGGAPKARTPRRPPPPR
ncbi:MAG: DUF2894 domain-containing protein [Acidovorax sp.]